MFRNGYVWLLALIFFSFNIGYYGINFWLHQLSKAQVLATICNGLLAALPMCLARRLWSGTADIPISNRSAAGTLPFQLARLRWA